jgi:hypothetical protein
MPTRKSQHIPLSTCYRIIPQQCRPSYFEHPTYFHGYCNPMRACEGPIWRPERGEWMGADKKFFSNGMTSQTRWTRSDTQNYTLRMQPSVCQNHVATEVLLVLETNTTSSINSSTHTAAKTTQEQAVWRGRLDRLHLVTEKSHWKTSSEHQYALQFHQQKSLVKDKLATRKSWRKPKLHPGAYGRLDRLPQAV